MAIYMGLDVHSKATFAHAQDAEGKTLFAGEVPTTVAGFSSLVDRLGGPKDLDIALETGTQAGFVAGALAAMGAKATVIDAREVRQKARRVGQKSDSRDAFEICDGWRRGVFTCVVWVPPPAVAELRALLSRRLHFVKSAASEVNAARRVLRSNGVKFTRQPSLATEKNWRELLAAPQAQPHRMFIELHLDVWLSARRAVAKLDAEIDGHLAEFGGLAERLATAPGVGRIVAASFIAAIGDPKRFGSSGQVASYLGLVPSTYDSGDRERHGSITKAGHGPTRAYFCEAAQHASRPTNPFNAYFAPIAAKSGRKRAVVAVAHRLSRVLWQMWKRGEDFNARKLNIEFNPTVRPRKVCFKRIKPAAKT